MPGPWHRRNGPPDGLLDLAISLMGVTYVNDHHHAPHVPNLNIFLPITTKVKRRLTLPQYMGQPLRAYVLLIMHQKAIEDAVRSF